MQLTKNLIKGYDMFIGIDVDKKSYAFSAVDGYSSIKSKKIPSEAEQLCNYIKKNYDDKKILCAYEAGPTGYSLHDYLKARNYHCFVISPSALLRKSNERVKNNRLDSQKIAEQLMAGQLTSIRIPEGAYRELRHLVKIRENYTKKRKEARQRISSLLLFENLWRNLKNADNNWSLSYIRELKGISCNDSVRLRLDTLLEDHDYARERLLNIHRKIKEFLSKNPEIEKYVNYAKSLPGVGFITATTFLGKVGDPGLLKNEKEVGCFVGLTPREHSTGDNIQRGSISHFGDPVLRGLLIEAAWVAIRRDTELEQFFRRIVSKNHPKGAAQIAITAVARKLTERLYRVLKDKRMYVIHKELKQ